MRFLLACAAATLLAAFCLSSSAALSRVQESLDVLVTAEPQEDYCRLVLAATNTGNRPIVLKFNTAQRHDFYAKDTQQRIIWKWSDGKVFANMQSKEKLQPGESFSYKAKWQYVRNDGRRAAPGKYWIMGALTAQPQNRYSQPVEIEVPKAVNLNSLLRGQVTDMGERVYLLGDDGIAYEIEDPDPLRPYSGKRIQVDDASIEPVPGSVDKKIRIRSYRLSHSSRS